MTTAFQERLAALDEGTVSLEQVLSFVDETVAQADSGSGAESGGSDHSGRRRAALRQSLDEWRRRSPAAAEAYSALIERRIAEAPSQAPDASVSESSDGEETVILARPIRGVGIGSVIKGRFRVEQELGAGGMGKVFKAVDQVAVDADDRNPYIALKVLSEGFRQHPKAFQTLQRETAKARRLAHPNIVRVYDCDRDGDTIFMTMEYLSGRALDSITKRPGFSGLPFDEVTKIIKPVADALAFAHRSGLIHSDFKPSNVFLTDSGPEEGRVKVIDFGIARAVKRQDVEETERTTFDIEALRVLTPAYASPEMSLDDHEPDPCDDIFALACVTYELLAGKHPFGRRPAIQAAQDGARAPRPPGLARSQWSALKRGLAFDRAKRTATVQRFVEDLVSPRFPPVLAAIGIAGALVATAAVIWLVVIPAVTTPSGRAPSLRAQVGAALAAIDCAVLEPTIDNGVVRIGGYAGGSADLEAAGASLDVIDGVQSVTIDPVRLEDTYCGALNLVSGLGPSAALSAADADGVSLSLRRTELVAGDRLILDVKAPSARSYIYVDLYMPDGYVQHLYPQPGTQQEAHADVILRLGRGGETGSWTIGSPFGTELIVAIASPEPLYEPYRWEVERAEDYLSDLRATLQRLQSGAEAPVLFDDVAVITTTGR